MGILLACMLAVNATVPAPMELPKVDVEAFSLPGYSYAGGHAAPAATPRKSKAKVVALSIVGAAVIYTLHDMLRDDDDRSRPVDVQPPVDCWSECGDDDEDD